MANAVNIDSRILELVDNNNPFAIALTGEWGIGKTHLWKELRNNNEKAFSGKKYAYVSLFGLDSLANLKSAIAIEVHKSVGANGSIWKKDILKPTKKVLSSLTGSSIGTTSDVRIGLNLGNNIITSVVFSHLKNTLVCLDDIERRSDSLSMSEIMGLVNYLKNERKCQVVMILHSDQSEDKDYFNKHKEKVFDELLVLDDSLSIIKDDIVKNYELFPIYEKFYKALEIKNLRFYQRVHKMFSYILENVDPNLSLESKRQILQSLLIITLAHDIPYRLDENISFDTFVKIFDENNSIHSDNFLIIGETPEGKKEEVDILRKVRAVLQDFYQDFLIANWGKLIINIIKNLELDSEIAQNCIEKDIINENILRDERLHTQVIYEYQSLKLEHKFPERLYYVACSRINPAQLDNLSLYCDILEACKRKDLSDKLHDHVKIFIKQKINSSQSKPSINDWYAFSIEPYERFYDFVLEALENYSPTNANTNTISYIFLRFYDKRIANDDDIHTLKLVDKVILRDMIWTEIDNERYRRQFIHSILLHPVLNKLGGKKEKVRQWIIELLNEKISVSPESEAPIKMWLSSTDNLTKNLF
ncbi:P-loop NTPase fold protein [Psychrobacter sp. APC 3281]|uniref:P-loop NTPase fold protein n=1 Tax=Psychrobacter sp. APC 3281 TaxID=3035190 RepID=UPI0025B3BD84|nr:P-loop NTPase fold protein [Psychrobacter sp. APC 3281]MDN3448310.1 P-loop NTPase fold protein [Psychrobacter sp. APC 3281]